MKLLYFAWVRARIGTAEESVEPPADVATVAQLVLWLKARGPNYAAALDDEKRVRVAVNRDYVGFDHAVRPEDEVAFFPPVTGG